MSAEAEVMRPISTAEEDLRSVETASVGPRHGVLRLLAATRDYGVLILLALLVTYMAITEPTFATTRNWLNIFEQIAPLGIIAIAQTLVLITAAFDLSVGAVAAISGVTFLTLVDSYQSPVGIAFSIAVALVVGCLIGAVSGASVSLIGINAFIATLAMGFIVRGIVLVWTEGKLVSTSYETVTDLGGFQFGGIRWTVWVLAAVTLAAFLATKFLAWGKEIYAVGGNARAAKLSGVRTARVQTVAFVLSGAAAATAGVMVAARGGSATPQAGVGYELDAIAAVVIGGTSISGGRGAVWRTGVGLLLVAVIGNSFDLLGLNPFYQQMTKGAVVLFAVGLDAVLRKSERN